MVGSAVIVVAAYLVGAIPVAYIFGRALKGIDLREYGSANVGASNVYRSVAGWAVVPVGLLEIAQGMAGVMLAKFLGQDLEVQVVAGLAAIAGQAWSVFLRFSGGRGIGPSIGFMLGLSPPVLATFIVISLLGWPLRSFPLTVGVAIGLTPLASAIIDGAGPVVAGCLGMALIVFAKRLLTNRIGLPGQQAGLPEGQDWRDVLLNRLLFDRDLRERDAWVHRTPGSSA
jgi:glycerol-3-phosphate acyltransferase PlsY